MLVGLSHPFNQIGARRSTIAYRSKEHAFALSLW